MSVADNDAFKSNDLHPRKPGQKLEKQSISWGKKLQTVPVIKKKAWFYQPNPYKGVTIRQTLGTNHDIEKGIYHWCAGQFLFLKRTF